MTILSRQWGETTKMKLGFQWKSQDVGDARAGDCGGLYTRLEPVKRERY